MANANQILSLIQSHMSGDDARFRTIALQIGATESKAGHTVLAKSIYDAVNTKAIRMLNLRQVHGEVDEMLVLENKNAHLSDLVVSADVQFVIERVLAEYEQRDRLLRHNLANRSKLMLHGPSGTGKTMSASVLATELGLPLYVVRLEKVITKFMGETGLKLSKIFDFIRDVPGVFLFDEFDAIGAQRGADNEVGEQRRILNTFLQLLDGQFPNSIIIAATNAIGSIDAALFRRFDEVMEYQLPTRDDVEKLVKKTTGRNTIILTNRFVELSGGLSHADICNICVDALKNELLYNMPIDDKALELLAERWQTKSKTSQMVG
ncbi:MAG: ATP-binding protein [Prevotellaceae bacterium]|nr:ATP-binding protein [Candidatus Faecinaster equi]